MVDAKKIASLIDDSVNIYIHDDKARERYRKKLIDAIGENKEEVVAFLTSTDADTLYMLDEIYEELVEKFGEEIDDIFINSENCR